MRAVSLPARQDARLSEIEGLRALLAVAVLAHHLDPKWLPGGFLGIDAFFVISGYVVTRGVRELIEAKHWSWPQFLGRRALRLLPSLMVAMLATWAAGWALLFAPQLTELAKATSTTLAGLGNLQALGWKLPHTPTPQSGPLEHLWSLALVAQFSLLLPLAMTRYSWLRRALPMGAVALLALALAALETHHFPQWAFYSLEGRGWQLLAGSWLACRTSVISSSSAGSLLHAGVLFLVLALAGIRVEVQGLQPASLAVICATLMILASAHKAPEGRLRRMLNHGLLQALGRSSYSIYLVHWPILTYAQTWIPGWTVWGQLSAAALSLLLGLMLHHLLERPLRSIWQQGLWLRGPLRLLGAVLAMALMALALVSQVQEGWLPTRGNRELLALVPEAKSSSVPVAQWVDVGMPEAAVSHLVLGDDHGQTLIAPLDGLLKKAGIKARVWLAPRTLPLIGARSSAHSDLFDREAMPEALAGPATQVVLIANWNRYLRETGTLRQLDGSAVDDAPALLASCLRQSLEQWKKAGKSVVLLQSWPEMPHPVAAWMLRHQRWKIPTPAAMIEPAAHEEAQALVNTLLVNAATAAGQRTLDPAPALTSTRGRLMHESAGKPLYLDQTHLSQAGAQRVAQWLVKTMPLQGPHRP